MSTKRVYKTSALHQLAEAIAVASNVGRILPVHSEIYEPAEVVSYADSSYADVTFSARDVFEILPDDVLTLINRFLPDLTLPDLTPNGGTLLVKWGNDDERDLPPVPISDRVIASVAKEGWNVILTNSCIRVHPYHDEGAGDFVLWYVANAIPEADPWNPWYV